MFRSYRILSSFKHSLKRASIPSSLMLLLFLIVYSADPSTGIEGKISPEIAAKLSAAKPDEIITVIVKMRAVPKINKIKGKRTAVFSELRRTAHESQKNLIDELSSPGTRSGVRKIRQFWIDNIILVKATKNVIETIAARPDVSKIFENFSITLPPMPERSTGSQPEETNPSVEQQGQLWDSIEKIGVKRVWSDYGLDGTGVVVGGLDTGVDISHPDLAGKMVTTNPSDSTYPGGWAEFDWEGGIVRGSEPRDTHGHGTHTSGTMLGGNTSGYDIGIAPGARLMHGLVIPGGSGSFAQVIGGMEWIVDPDGDPLTNDGAQVVNMSLGAAGIYPEMIPPTDNMVAANVFPSFSIGNDGYAATGSPGNVPSAFGVGATDSSDVIAGFSSRGPVTWDAPPYVGTWIKPDISAPGVNIYSCVPGGDWEGDWSGTSMAAPHVAGTVALLCQLNPSITVDLLKQLLAQTAIDYGPPGMDNSYGWGRIDAYGAVQASAVGVGTIEGTVYSSVGGTINNAKIHIVDTGQKVYSNSLGFYSLAVMAGDHALEVSHFGYETFDTLVTVDADAVTIQDVTLMQLPSGTIAGFLTDKVTGDGIAAAITVILDGDAVVWSSTDPLTGAYSIVLPVGTYDIVFSPEFPYPTTTKSGIQVFEDITTFLDVPLGTAQVLVVDDDEDKDYGGYYEQAVVAAGRTYVTLALPPTADEMALFESVVWLTGDDYKTTLTETDQTELAAYLDNGGRLFLSGQDIGNDIKDTAFYTDYLHADYVQDDVNLGGVLGVTQSPVGAGFAFLLKGGDGADNQRHPSEIDPVPPAQQALVYDPSVPEATVMSNDLTRSPAGSMGIISSGTAALTYDSGTYKIVYFTFGFEAIATEDDRNVLMGRILDWLQGYPEITHTPFGDTEDTENPYPITAVITSNYFPLDPSTFAVIYDTGGSETTLPMFPTGNPNEYMANIPPQPLDTEVYYYITASDTEGHTTRHPLAAPMSKFSFLVARDEEAPVVEHQRHFAINDLEGPYGICADITDNIGVESADLMYAKNGGVYNRIEMELQEGDRYCGAIPGPSIVGDSYEYYIYVIDQACSSNVTRVPAEGAFQFEIVEEFVWDFELDDGGFTETGGVWEWGQPGTGPGDAFSGVNVWATLLDGAYPSRSDATLETPTVTLSGNKPYAILSFRHWYDIEAGFDGGNVKVSTDGGTTWNILKPFGGYDGTGSTYNMGIPHEPCFTGYSGVSWQEELFDLSFCAGRQVILCFHFGSDYNTQKLGWYVDDVRLRSTEADEFPPVFSSTEVPTSTFNTTGPYEASTSVKDPLSGVGSVSLFYNTDGGTSFTEIQMRPTTDPDQWSAGIPGQPRGTKVKFYIRAMDSSVIPVVSKWKDDPKKTDGAEFFNQATDPPGAPAETYEFAVLPHAQVLVIAGSENGTPIDVFRDAIEAGDFDADYWDLARQGWLPLDKLELYQILVLDEPNGLTSTQQADLGVYLDGGIRAAKRRIFLLGHDLAWSSSTRSWIEQYMRAAYVQDDPLWREITGVLDDPIGAGETFVISGNYTDEVQRSVNYPGGEIVYRYTGPGTILERAGAESAYIKTGKKWDGFIPHSPKSLDAAAGIKYNAETYRSVYFTFNFDNILESERRTAIIGRVLDWLLLPEIVHTPLRDTEDTLSAYTVAGEVYSETLDPNGINLTYNVGNGPVIVQMIPSGTPDEYKAEIPPQPFGTTVSYYVSAANTDGNTAYHPPRAPADLHFFRVTADTIPPDIVHEPFPNTHYTSAPYAIEAVITDNTGVDPGGVLLTYNKNGGADATIPMTSPGGDLFEANIPGPSALGDVYNYYIQARDTAKTPNTARSPAEGFHSFTTVDYYTWDFEKSDGGFTTTGPDWEWGGPRAGPDSAFSGLKLWATKVGGNYSAGSNSKLNLPPVIVPSSATYAILSFRQWYYIERNFDGGNVKLSTDGGSTWTILKPDIDYNGVAEGGNAGIPGENCFTGYDKNFWHRTAFNLTEHKGRSVILQLHFGSDNSVQKVGWYVDDVRIEGIEDNDGPVFVSMEVPAGTFDTAGPYTVTTVAADLLSGISTATLYYSTDDGSNWSSVSMNKVGNSDSYSGDIPGQPSGTRVLLYVAATDNSGNTSTDPAGAPAANYEFGIMPSGDYLVLLGGELHAPSEMFQQAFSAIGKTADTWEWGTDTCPNSDMDDPTPEILNYYRAVIVDESEFPDETQRQILGEFLETNDGTPQQIFFLGCDLSYYSFSRSWMEQYTGAAYERDDPGMRRLTSAPGDPIGAGETFTIQGSYPDELKLSTEYPGAHIVYKYSGVGSNLDLFETEQELTKFYEKQGKKWDPKLWPVSLTGPDSAAAVRYVGTTYASVYFAFNFDYIQESSRRAGILDRVLGWLASATGGSGTGLAAGEELPEIPDKLTLRQNYPNPFNPMTTIKVGIPDGIRSSVNLKIYNVRGQLVKTVFEGTKSPGFHAFVWDGTNNNGQIVSSGIYFSCLTAGELKLTRKLILLK